MANPITPLNGVSPVGKVSPGGSAGNVNRKQNASFGAMLRREVANSNINHDGTNANVSANNGTGANINANAGINANINANAGINANIGANINAGINFSKHALARAEERGIELTPDLMDRLAGSVEKAQEKGAKNILAFDSTQAFIINIQYGRVITTMSQAEMRNNIFTNIDGAVLL